MQRLYKHHECHREALFAEVTLGIPHAYGAIPFHNHSYKLQQRQEIAAPLTSVHSPQRHFVRFSSSYLNLNDSFDLLSNLWYYYLVETEFQS
ncbi:MAG TPA: hypothetical protein VKA34_02555 [Balneolales bacterium]|nr:hypothetical protein [Balneolales bacterium]